MSAGRKFSEKHEWVDVSGNIGTIGITDYAQDSLGDIVYAQLPEPGSEFSLGGKLYLLKYVILIWITDILFNQSTSYCILH